MSEELLAILEHIEREKGIDKEILCQAVETALVSAVRKAADVKPDQEITVELDRKTGKIKAFVNKEEIKSTEFSRIAAQTAKQVIIQKIREAEKDVVFKDFKDRVGQIISGVVYRFEKGNIIVDLLGKAEAILLKKEQVGGEEFRQGERIRAYILDVRKESKGPQIIVSRSHPNMVKKLFELEVPEIYEGIVEIKSISREAGERTKIAVWSKDEKIDCVGACVGMRGSRVKNIVSEVRGEKIDIVRWSDDIKEYIKASLSPAKIKEISFNKENKKATVFVDEDQLSLAIGKHGQNVRLASRLVGWELDIRTKVKPEEVPEKIEQKEVGPSGEKTPLEKLSGVGEKTISLLQKAGFMDVESIINIDIEKLLEIKGIGKVKAQKIIEQAKKIIKDKNL